MPYSNLFYKNTFNDPVSSYSSNHNILFSWGNPSEAMVDIPTKTSHNTTGQPNETWTPGSPCSLIIKKRGIKPMFSPSEPSSFLDFLDKRGSAVSLTFQDTGTSRFQMPKTSPRKRASLNLPFSNVPVGRKHFFFPNQPYINKLNFISLG